MKNVVIYAKPVALVYPLSIDAYRNQVYLINSQIYLVNEATFLWLTVAAEIITNILVEGNACVSN